MIFVYCWKAFLLDDVISVMVFVWSRCEFGLARDTDLCFRLMVMFSSKHRRQRPGWTLA